MVAGCRGEARRGGGAEWRGEVVAVGVAESNIVRAGKYYPVGRFFVSPRKDPVTFVVNCILSACLRELFRKGAKGAKLINEKGFQSHKGHRHEHQPKQVVLPSTIVPRR